MLSEPGCFSSSNTTANNAVAEYPNLSNSSRQAPPTPSTLVHDASLSKTSGRNTRHVPKSSHHQRPRLLLLPHRETLGDLGEHAAAARRVSHERQVFADALDQRQSSVPWGELKSLLNNVVGVLILLFHRGYQPTTKKRVKIHVTYLSFNKPQQLN